MRVARPRTAAVIGLGLLGLTGCNRTDPVLDRPCGQRGTPTVVLGIGQFTYVPLGDQGPLVDTDLQAGDYVWLGVGCTGLGPDVTLNFGIKDATTGDDLSAPPEQRVLLAYNGSAHDDEVPGLQAPFLPSVNAKEIVGKAVTIWADVADSCWPAGVHGERASHIEGFDVATCVGCLDQACHAELAACGDECHAIQGCLDAYCVGLSTIGSPDEDLCQQFCQAKHASAKQAHIDVVTCVQDLTRGGLCNTQACQPNPVAGAEEQSLCFVQPPCFAYSIDYRHCVNLQNDPVAGPCKDALAACTGSAACQSYQSCIKSCTSWATCQACAQTASGAVGEPLFEAHQACLEQTCLAQGWLPHL